MDALRVCIGALKRRGEKVIGLPELDFVRCCGLNPSKFVRDMLCASDILNICFFL